MKAELFDIFDEGMNLIGQATRAEAHAKGYWHQTFHCWLTRREGEQRFVQFQLRTATKDTNPSCYDITAAGHLSAGETVAQAVRELEEELGVAVPFEQLVPILRWQEEDEGEANGVPYIDREFSHVFGLVWDEPLAAMRLQVDEVAGLYEAELSDMIALFAGQIEAVEASGIMVQESDSGSVNVASHTTVRASQFVPRDPAYYIQVLRALQELT
ncbi:NUDIX domain-containing protein [Paenibacillus cellulosilyticus]|uniref:NUDIX domain-containing protein n=1 Tax=Paenibacillus cellulosilyticus TaxID=375489 RepID=A0A2V2YEM8_9BACL|nr:NUDIX domain-containing protein [Paenibacillus cellulosilyticus]PWV90650.1 NUDIX domain-containing protein [Paenibacillus cellulosilyticus]QKS43928.1 NUDIX domain-containing protein [Paenibacillus cellulosilyticus]